jgi:hypothetical protein
MSERAFQISHGMAWQPEKSDALTMVQRTASFNGYAILRVWAARRNHDLDAGKGRSIRVWDPPRHGHRLASEDGPGNDRKQETAA